MTRRVAIQPDKGFLPNGKIQSFSDRWIALAQKAGYDVQIVDVCSNSIIDQLRDCDGFLWRFSIGTDEKARALRILPIAEEQLGLQVFPNRRTIWHYDDKVTQKYLLEAAGIPTPRTWVFWSSDAALEFCRQSNYPLVLKLAGGASSKNVMLLHSVAEAEIWITRLFSSGLFELKSPEGINIKNATSALRSVMRYLIKGKLSRPSEHRYLNKNYVLFQEYLPRNEYDTRITVIGNRAFGFRRFNRPNDFRASGSGLIDWDPDAVDAAFIRLAFKIADVLQMQTVAIDGLYNGKHVVTAEISYTYLAGAVHDCPGHWMLDGDAASGTLTWVEGNVWPQDAIWEDFVMALDSGSQKGKPVPE